MFQGLANQYGTHCFIGEWGVFGDPNTDVFKLKRFAAAEDERFMGSTWWQWCQAPGDPHGIDWTGQVYKERDLALIEVGADGNYTGVRNELYLNVLSRTRPIAIHGKPRKLVSNPDDGTMLLRAKATESGTTLLWVPNRFGTPKITGSKVALESIKEVEGGHHVQITVEGDYELLVEF